MESQPVPPVAPTPDRKGLAIASLVLGIVCLCFTCLMFVPYVGVIGLIGSILSFIFGILGLKSSLKGLAIAGIVLSSISLAVWIVVVVIVGGVMAGPAIGNVFSKLNSNLASPH